MCMRIKAQLSRNVCKSGWWNWKNKLELNILFFMAWKQIETSLKPHSSLKANQMGMNGQWKLKLKTSVFAELVFQSDSHVYFLCNLKFSYSFAGKHFSIDFLISNTHLCSYCWMSKANPTIKNTVLSRA